MLAQVIGYLKLNRSIHSEQPPESALALANAARVSRLLYRLAMPLLWEEVLMTGPRDINPYTLLKYPWTVEHVSYYIRTVRLNTNRLNGDMSNTKLDGVCKYLSVCLRILTTATRVKSLYLYFHLYNVDDHPPEFRTRLRTINNLVYRILRHVETMDLDKLYWDPDPKTDRSSDSLGIIGRRITHIRLCRLEHGDWIDHLHNCERLTSIEIHDSRGEKPAEFDRKFWTAIAQLGKCTQVTANKIPIPSGWGLQFENIINLDLSLPILNEPYQWINTVTAVFKYMWNLETLALSAPDGDRFQQACESIEILDVACKNLKEICIDGYIPKRILQTIGGECPNLTRCDFHIHNLNDDDLYAISRCQNIRHFSIRCLNSITNGLAYFTNLPQLTELKLNYILGDCITTELLLDFARFCPHLETINLTDYNTGASLFEPPGLFLIDDISDIFAAADELRVYLEPQFSTSDWKIDVLDQCCIRIDNLRRDKLADMTKEKGIFILEHDD